MSHLCYLIDMTVLYVLNCIILPLYIHPLGNVAAACGSEQQYNCILKQLFKTAVHIGHWDARHMWARCHIRTRNLKALAHLMRFRHVFMLSESVFFLSVSYCIVVMTLHVSDVLAFPFPYRNLKPSRHGCKRWRRRSGWEQCSMRQQRDRSRQVSSCSA